MMFLLSLILIFINERCNTVIAFRLIDLQNAGLNSNVFVSDVVVYLNRAFLAVPRTVCQNNITGPTLLEVPWKEFNSILKIRHIRSIDKQLWAQCDNLQNAVSLAKEKAKSKLWILDQGNEYCPPKIMVYSLYHNSFSNQSIDLSYVPKQGLNTILIENSTTLGNHRAFVSNVGSNAILSCNLENFVCTHLKMVNINNPMQSVTIKSMAISKTTSKLYFVDITDDVYYINLNTFSDEDISDHLLKDGRFSVNITLLGQTLGPSSGLETDLKKGLIYYLTRDYAVVRWIIGKSMTAENYDVLAQSYKRMPYVSRIFTDPQNGVWALVNPFNPENCTTELENMTGLERVAKIMRYNRLLDMFL